MAEEWFTVRIDVSTIIFGIDVFVETGTVVYKRVQKVQFDRVFCIWLKKFKVEHLDTVIKKLNISFSSSLFVDQYGRYFLTLEIDEKVFCSFCQAKSNFDLASILI